MSTALVIIRNAADILILAFVFYKILVLLKGNRAMQLIKGIVFLLLAYYVSGWLRLETIHSLLSQSGWIIIIAVLVVFQPELRSLLEYLGSKGNLLNFSSKRSEPRERLIAALIKALEEASASKTGVLIVLEGITGLKEYTVTGTAIDAVVSKELLGNIFFKNSPLHDGALIIRGTRIAAAGCIMPLTDDPSLDTSLGTRHRAAVGITEKSDCLALVVSEENGGVSVAWNGRLCPCPSPARAEKMIRDFYASLKKKSKAKKQKSTAAPGTNPKQGNGGNRNV